MDTVVVIVFVAQWLCLSAAAIMWLGLLAYLAIIVALGALPIIVMTWMEERQRRAVLAAPLIPAARLVQRCACHLCRIWRAERSWEGRRGNF